MPVSITNGKCHQLRRPFYAGHKSSYLDLIEEEELEAYANMDEIDGPKKSASSPEVDQLAAAREAGLKPPPSALKANGIETPMEGGADDYLSVQSTSYSGANTPGTPGTISSSDGSSGFDSFGQDSFPPVDRLTMFDILENFALPQRLEKMQNAIHDNAEKLRRQRARLASRAISGKNMVGEWRKKVPAPEEQLDKYQKRMKQTVERLNKRWNAAKTVTMKEKISFVTAVLNIFISAYLIGGWPEYFHYWYTIQLAYVHTNQILLLMRRSKLTWICVGTSCPSDGTTTTRSASTTSSPTSATLSTSSSSSPSGSSRSQNASSSAHTVSPSAITLWP